MTELVSDDAEEVAESTDSDAELLKEGRERFKMCEEWWAHNRKAALEDMKFRAGDQWPEEVRTQRESAIPPQPCLTVDKLNQYVRQVVNDERQNRPGIKVSPINDGDEYVAQAFAGIIRHIWDRSNADEALDCAGEQAVVGGFGWMRVITEYAGESTFNQEIAIVRISNQLSVICDPFCKKADKSDMRFAFVEDAIPKEDFADQYPDAKETNWDSDGYKDGWLDDQGVRICEYWYVVEESRKLHLLADGTTTSDEDYQAAVAQNETLDQKIQLPAIVESREIPLRRVKWCRMSGAEILEKKEWLGKYIPLIFVCGNEYNIDGKVIYCGLIRPGKDAQMLFNYARTKFAQRVALTPLAPWLVDVEAVEGYEEEWEGANNGDKQALFHKSYNENGQELPVPKRIDPTDIPVGFAKDMEMSEHDIQGALGMYASSLGQRGNATSGRQEIAQIREADTGTFHYIDNLNRAVRFLGRILVDLAPKIIDTKQSVRILGEDGKATQAMVDPEQQQAVMKIGNKSIYNLGVGEYDVTVSAGPSYTTKRAEANQAMMELAQRNPAYWQTHGDLIAQSQDWPNAEAFAKRSKALLPPQIQQMEQEEDVSPEVQQAQMQAKQVIDQAQQQIHAAEAGIAERDQALQQKDQEIAALQQEQKNKEAEAQLKARELELRMFEAETARLEAQKTEDNSIELVKLEYEDKWKKLDAETQLTIAAMRANQQEEANVERNQEHKD